MVHQLSRFSRKNDGNTHSAPCYNQFNVNENPHIAPLHRVLEDDPAVWVPRWRERESARLKEELLRTLNLLVPGGQRIRYLRECLGWTQETAAVQLGISTRTLIRHEQDQHRRPWLRLPLLLRLRELEAEHAEDLINYFARGGSKRG